MTDDRPPHEILAEQILAELEAAHAGKYPSMEVNADTPDTELDQFLFGDPEIIEYEDMTDEQKRIVDAGNEIAGTFPQGMTKEQRVTWMKERFGV